MELGLCCSSTSHSGQYDHGHGILQTPHEHSVFPIESLQHACRYIEKLDIVTTSGALRSRLVAVLHVIRFSRTFTGSSSQRREVLVCISRYDTCALVQAQKSVTHLPLLCFNLGRIPLRVTTIARTLLVP